jgi:poly-beta-1,6-N-acetyl-D-glucosamine biosynthesis protein PgaD
MSGSLIIDARHRLRWYQRLLSDACTAAMWGIWLWLWSPALSSFARLAQLGARAPGPLKLLGQGGAADLHYCVAALVGTSGTLLVWNRLPASPRVRGRKMLSLSDYAGHFELHEHAITSGRRTPVCVVHHDDSGRIVRLECRDVPCSGSSMAA